MKRTGERLAALLSFSSHAGSTDFGTVRSLLSMRGAIWRVPGMRDSLEIFRPPISHFRCRRGNRGLDRIIRERPSLSSALNSVHARIPLLCVSAIVACFLVWAGYRFSFG